MKRFLIIFLSCLFCFPVFAAPIKEVVFFGDSLSDDGNLLKMLKIVPKSPPYYKGRFSNGLTWAEHVGKYFYDKNYIAYANYAYGGATAVLHDIRTDPFIAPMLLEAELDGYFMRSPLSDKSNVLFGIWIGANDYLYEKVPDITALTDKVVDKISWSIHTLVKKGAQHFLIMNLPDLSKAPYAKNHDNEARLAAISIMHNQKLQSAINRLKEQYPTVNFIYFDVYEVFLDLLSNPEKYNQKYGTHLTDTRNACWLGTVFGLQQDEAQLTNELQAEFANRDVTLISDYIKNSPSLSAAYTIGKQKDRGKEPCNNAEQHLFWDDLHPTAIVHQVLGQIIVEKIEATRIM